MTNRWTRREIPVLSHIRRQGNEGFKKEPQVSVINVLLIGSGGREHALAWKLAASPVLGEFYAAPGNPGIAELAQCVDLDFADHQAVIAFCKDKSIGLVVIGPEAPLVAGIVDDLSGAGIKTFGPTRAAAQLEGSKGFTKELCSRHGIPTARYSLAGTKREALERLHEHALPVVIKADGLAAGKGVTVAFSRADAEAAIENLFSGGTGAKAVIEEYLEGEEASFFVLADGTHAVALATAQDHKRAHDQDTGPNTGGMGAYSPAPVMSEELCRRTMEAIVLPTIKAMRDEGAPFKGVLYAGLMITHEGPKLIEYNVRFGDPECQALMVRLKDDLLILLIAAVEGELDHVSVRWNDTAALTVVMAANGYPGDVVKGSEIRGLDRVAALSGVEIFHAGTALTNGRLVANGGRVLNVTAIGRTVGEAQSLAYHAVDLIDWPEGYCRRDIGFRAVEREKTTAAQAPSPRPSKT
jgi:phosphoribosylamine--glycine ligase